MKAYLLERAPDYFICPLSLDLMSNPVVAHDGLFYEKSIIEAHCNYCLQSECLIGDDHLGHACTMREGCHGGRRNGSLLPISSCSVKI